MLIFFNNTDFQFDIENLTQKSYTITKDIPTTNWVELINKYKFAKIIPDKA